MASNLRKVGAAWIKDRRNEPGKFLSAKIECAIPDGASVLIFKNDHKKEDRQPDYNLFCPEDELGETPQAGEQEHETPPDDDIPF